MNAQDGKGFANQINKGIAMSSPVVLITGALDRHRSSATVAFAQEGARQALSFVVRQVVEIRKVEDLGCRAGQGLGAEAIFVHADVRNENDVRDLVDQVYLRVGHLDVAVNYAGTGGETWLGNGTDGRNLRGDVWLRMCWVRCSARKYEMRVMPVTSKWEDCQCVVYSTAGQALPGASICAGCRHPVEGLTQVGLRRSRGIGGTH